MPLDDARLNLGLDASTGLSTNLSQAEQELLGHTAKRHPTALGKVADTLTHGDNNSSAISEGIDDLTGLPRSPFLGDGPLYGDEFESGIVPIDYAVYQLGKAYQKISDVVEAGKPMIGHALEEVASQIGQELRQNVQSIQEDWQAPDNQLRHWVEEQAPQLLQRVRQLWKDVAANPQVQEITETFVEIGQKLSDQAEDAIQAAQTRTEQWANQLFEESYLNGIDQKSQHRSAQLTHPRQENSPFVGIIDTHFTGNSHGRQVAQMIEQKGQQPLDWYGIGVGSGNWSDSLIEFVDAAKASGRSQAVINLSFELTQINPDGSVDTRHKLTPEEYAALTYAHNNRVLLVVATGNQGDQMSALGQASQKFDNIIAVGAAEDGQRANYSSYGEGIDFVASGQGQGDMEGTSLSAARVTGAITQIWQANPDLSYQQVIQVLQQSATDLQQPGIDPFTGVGQPHVGRAIEMAEDRRGAEIDPNHPNLSGTQPDLLFNENGSTIPSERPAWLEGLKDAASSGWDTFKAQVAEPIVELLPEPVEEFVRNVGNTAEETVSDVVSDPGRIPEILQDAANDLSTAVEGTTYPGYPFEYEPGTMPVCDPNVQKWQARMQERGWKIAVDGMYGAHSAEVARQFQQEKGLTPDGIVGPETWAAAFSTRNEVDPAGEVARGALPVGVAGTGEESSRVFRYEPGQELSYNSDVERWQQRMRDRGWNIEVDGYYGEQSTEVARQFQAEKGLVADGVVGERTWEEAFRTDNLTSPSTGTLVGSGLSAEALPGGTTPDSSYPEYSGQITQNSSLSDNMRAFLDTISYAEGTHAPDGYRIRFGGDRFDSFADHPRIHEPFRDTTSTAAGRYQFIQRTWDGVRGQIGLSDFSPQNQDLAAVQLIRNRGAYEDVEAGRFEIAVAKVAGEWASFPGAGYNQPEKSLPDLKEFYEASLRNYQEGVVQAPLDSSTGFSDTDSSSSESYKFDVETHRDILERIRDVEDTIPGKYDPYVAAQTLRRKTNEKYQGGSFEIFTKWRIPLVNRLPFVNINEEANSTYAKAEELEEFQGWLPLENGMKVPTAHFLASISAQFGTLLGSEPSYLTYTGDLGSALGAIHRPSEWITTPDTQERDKQVTQLESFRDLSDRLHLALEYKSPPAQLDSGITAHVVGHFVESRNIRISEAISTVSQMSKEDIYDTFLKIEFGHSLAELNDPVTGGTKSFETRTKIEDRVSGFIYDYTTMMNMTQKRFVLSPSVPFTLDLTSLKLISEYLLRHVGVEIN
ncbi:MAG: peptidoglycan-binding protein [Elainella sp. Prado103]|jgi:muramidase (phage lysozyme)|nr:peptidoglycan-binding protein [Elainella sp. Prado103]